MPFHRHHPLTSSSTSTTETSSSKAPSPKILLDDDELLLRVQKANAAVALKKALTAPLHSWDTIHQLSSIRLGSGTRRELFDLSWRTSGDTYEVFSVGCIACSPRELVSVLNSRHESEYNAAMKGLYARQFIYGSIVHISDSLPLGHRLGVRTACFARSKLLARNQQWCYLDYFQPTSETVTGSMSSDISQGFSISLISLSEHELAVGKARGGRVDQLDNITALIVVDTIPAVSKDVSDGKLTKLRIMFHALHSGNKETAIGHVSDKIARARLNDLGRGISHLPALLRRRRLGMQVFAAESVVVSVPKPEVQNSRCISCTKGIRLGTLIGTARRCQLCAYHVCMTCWSRENIETENGHVMMMGVCTRCLEWVDRCDYSFVQVGRRGPVRIMDDPPLGESKSRRGQHLCNELAVESTKEAAVTVIKMLIDQSQTLTEDRDTAGSEEDRDFYMSAVEEYFQRRAQEAPAAADCVLSNAQHRTYSLHPLDISAPPAPLPENEAARLTMIDQLGLMDLKDPMPELDIICSFLSKELGFFGSMVTIVGASHQLILSSTIQDFVHALLPREHTFCQHLLMGDAPFIIRHPEADIRFYNLNPVTLQGVRYYCGIPVLGPNGLMVGSICCVHTSAMDITRSQYDTLVRFGEIASKIIRVKAEAKRQSKVR
ncbi:hypothetical protein PsorP6_010347 [Peronosclerospora sorghi]|uniref:Uncharacterized protein n=1 Tax=Peronosclerospora sorghi TaxID=230839 RepID=A0ACC0VVL3_9STRA|nr:hypothetical protein PsorP6_010347 [Peronosclerospora sorghi]